MIWVVGVVAWFVVRFPYARRARRTKISRQGFSFREAVLLTISAFGLGVVPITYVTTGFPSFADYPFHPVRGWLGAAVFASAILLFRLTHKELGRNWSVTLQIREQHTLVQTGIYRWMRHPMYAAFWLWAFAQLLLLPNVVAGLAGIVGFGTLFFLRVGSEEKLMFDAFGEDYRAYSNRTWRIFPGVF